MRVVSWLVVSISLVWLATFGLRPMFDGFPIPAVPTSMVTGTIAAAPGGELIDFASRYTEAWNSHDPVNVAAFYGSQGSVRINDGERYTGTQGVMRMARGFMTDVPDIVVNLKSIEKKGDRVVFYWSFSGTHARTGNQISIEGSESWLMGPDGLIIDSIGTFDAVEYERQVNGSL